MFGDKGLQQLVQALGLVQRGGVAGVLDHFQARVAQLRKVGALVIHRCVVAVTPVASGAHTISVLYTWSSPSGAVICVNLKSESQNL